MNLFQERIEELGSAIIHYNENNIYIEGFYSSERLMDWLNGSDCWQSKGIYDKQEVDYSRIQDNSLIIVMQNSIEVIRYQYKPFFKGVVKYNNLLGITASRIFTLRKCLYTKQYNIIFADENNDKQSRVYNDIQALEEGFQELFPNCKLLDVNNKIISEGFNYVRKMEVFQHQIVAFDVETPNRYNNKICSIGLTVINDGIITNTFHYLVNPETEFDRMNIQIHGIKPSDVANAPTFPEVWNEISELFRSSLITAHNATFDLCVLRKTLLAYGINESIVYYVCTLQMACSIIAGIENYKLPTLARYAGIDLQHHNAQSDSICCAELLRFFLNSGIDLDKHMKSFDLTQVDLDERKPSFPKALSNQSQTLKALKDVLSAITCDNILHEHEIFFLHNWLEENKELAGNFPYDKIFSIISETLADGIIEKHELDSMLGLFQQISDPVGSLCNNCSSFDIEGKNIVLTGDFDRGDRKSLELELTSFGAVCKNSVSKTTHYLIVGGLGSSLWYAGNYGTKVKRALELQASGISIEIIRELDFYTALRKI